MLNVGDTIYRFGTSTPFTVISRSGSDCRCWLVSTPTSSGRDYIRRIRESDDDFLVMGSEDPIILRRRYMDLVSKRGYWTHFEDDWRAWTEDNRQSVTHTPVTGCLELGAEQQRREQEALQALKIARDSLTGSRLSPNSSTP